MRHFLIVLLSLSVAGCGSVQTGVPGVLTAFANFTSSPGTDVDLEALLYKDAANKSAQLSFLSLGKYECGDPMDKKLRKRLAYDWTDAERIADSDYWKTKRESAQKSLNSDDLVLKAVIDYGNALSKAQKDEAAFEAAMGDLTSTLNGIKPLDPAGSAVFTALSAAETIAVKAGGFLVNAKITEMARAADKGLQTALTQIGTDSFLKGLSVDEMVAFGVWDSCAHERLAFLRDFDPQQIPVEDRRNAAAAKAGASFVQDRLRGEAPTSLVDFANEYKAYLVEREGYIGKRPDFTALLKALVDANHKMAFPPKDGDVNWYADNLAYLAQAVSGLYTAQQAAHAAIAAAETKKK